MQQGSGTQLLSEILRIGFELYPVEAPINH